MEKLKNEISKEKKYEWFEVVEKGWNNYKLKIWNVEWNFNCKNFFKYFEYY